jgi:hypothetical protein
MTLDLPIYSTSHPVQGILRLSPCHNLFVETVYTMVCVASETIILLLHDIAIVPV